MINRVANDDYSLQLLANGGETEVMLYEIWADKPAHIVPGSKSGLMEFLYILEGSLTVKADNRDTNLTAGDHFHVFNISGNIQMQTRSGARILYVSSQPVFSTLNDYYDDLMELLRQSEEKDTCTHNHGQRVQHYSVRICEQMGLSEDIIADLQIASLFHDIGKLNVPDELLNKAGNLTQEEFDCIRKHPADSGILLEGRFDNSRVCEIATQHHEWIDGTGYPLGLTEDQIVLEAKIIAVADSYDAMTSDRAYRRALPPSEAVEELRRFSGTHYEPKVVEALISSLVEEGMPI